ncbi:MAG TPA: DNA polymerase III subunit delta' [Bacilli bacterium]
MNAFHTDENRAVEMLQSGFAAGKLSHAYIFHGPKGTGKRKAAMRFAQMLFCTADGPKPCENCAACRKFAHGNHPDLHVVAPDGGSIKIEQIRDLQRRFFYRSEEAQVKVYVIEQAELMTVQAANALLKFLEEPSAQIKAILLTENGHALLPTIRSRAQWVSFHAANPADMEAALMSEGHAPALVRAAVMIAAGQDEARELLQTNWFAELLNVMIQLCQESADNPQGALVTLQQRLIKANLAEHIDTLLDLMLLWYKDLVHLGCGRKRAPVFAAHKDWLEKQARQSDVSRWIICLEAIVETSKRLRYHVNPQLALEQLVIVLGRR